MSAAVIDQPMPMLETSRLRLRPYLADDIEPMAAMFGDRDVTAFTFLGQRDRAQTETVLREYMAFLAAHNWGMFAIFDKESGGYLGEAGLFFSPMETVALRYALSKTAWGKGYAAEASAAVIDDAFGRMALPIVYAGVKAENKASVRVMEKLGFTYRETLTGAGHTFGLYDLNAAEWSAHRASEKGG